LYHIPILSNSIAKFGRIGPYLAQKQLGDRKKKTKLQESMVQLAAKRAEDFSQYVNNNARSQAWNMAMSGYNTFKEGRSITSGHWTRLCLEKRPMMTLVIKRLKNLDSQHNGMNDLATMVFIGMCLNRDPEFVRNIWQAEQKSTVPE
jgi:hypothetical protein